MAFTFLDVTELSLGGRRGRALLYFWGPDALFSGRITFEGHYIHGTWDLGAAFAEPLHFFTGILAAQYE